MQDTEHSAPSVSHEPSEEAQLAESTSHAEFHAGGPLPPPSGGWAEAMSPSASEQAFGPHLPAPKHRHGLRIMELNSEYGDPSKRHHDSNPGIHKNGTHYTNVRHTARLVERAKPDVVLFEDIDRWYAHHGNARGSHKGLIEDLKHSYKVIFPPGTRAGVMVRTKGHHVHVGKPTIVDDPTRAKHIEDSVFVHVTIDGVHFLAGAEHFMPHPGGSQAHTDAVHRREANAVMNFIGHDHKHHRHEQVLFGGDFNEVGGQRDGHEDHGAYRALERDAGHAFGRHSVDAKHWRDPAGQRSQLPGQTHQHSGVLGVFSTLATENKPHAARHTGPANLEEHTTQIVVAELPDRHR